MKSMIDILLAAYNGEKFLAEQLDSILSQTEKGWRIIICDDCSSDGTFEIAQKYAERFPEKIKAVRNDTPSGSAKANFIKMMSLSEGDYIMFSDQDDLWLKDKIKVTLDRMTEAEKKHPNEPVAVHTELMIADSRLEVIHRSFTKYQGLDANMRSLNRLLAQNNVTGCTMMINRPLADLVKNISPDDMLMHDWWTAIAAAAFGRIEFVDIPTIKYRQHGNNQLGAVNNRSLSGIIKVIKERANTQKRVSMTYTQAEKFYSAYKNILPPEAEKILKIYLSIPGKNKITRAALLIKYGFLKQNPITAAGQLLFC